MKAVPGKRYWVTGPQPRRWIESAMTSSEFTAPRRLRFVEQTSAVAGYEKIDAPAVRLMYRIVAATPLGDYDLLNRFAY